MEIEDRKDPDPLVEDIGAPLNDDTLRIPFRKSTCWQSLEIHFSGKIREGEFQRLDAVLLFKNDPVFRLEVRDSLSGWKFESLGSLFPGADGPSCIDIKMLFKFPDLRE